MMMVTVTHTPVCLANKENRPRGFRQSLAFVLLIGFLEPGLIFYIFYKCTFFLESIWRQNHRLILNALLWDEAMSSLLRKRWIEELATSKQKPTKPYCQLTEVRFRVLPDRPSNDCNNNNNFTRICLALRCLSCQMERGRML